MRGSAGQTSWGMHEAKPGPSLADLQPDCKQERARYVKLAVGKAWSGDRMCMSVRVQRYFRKLDCLNEAIECLRGARTS